MSVCVRGHRGTGENTWTVPAKQVRKAINFCSQDTAVHTRLFIILSCLLVSWIRILVGGQRHPDFMRSRLLLLLLIAVLH